MLLLVGLGNPGPEYQRTRHNAGWMYIDYVAEGYGASPFRHDNKFEAELADVTINGITVMLVKPLTYVNNSGRSVSKLMNFYKLTPSDLVVAHDDLDLPLGQFRIQIGTGPKGHNGLISIEKSIVSIDFKRIRIGVDSRTSEERKIVSGEDYVLKPMEAETERVLHNLFPYINVLG
jgi:PTH1 family peptidyl-tRNA hydrolase